MLVYAASKIENRTARSLKQRRQEETLPEVILVQPINDAYPAWQRLVAMLVLCVGTGLAGYGETSPATREWRFCAVPHL